MEAKTLTPHKIFEVIIHGKPYDVYSIEGKEHEGQNGTSTTWWLYYSDRLPDNLVPPADSESFLPYSKSIKRLVWEIKIKDNNTSKHKWDETMFSHGTSCELWCNNRQIYGFFCRDTEYAMAKCQTLMTLLPEHSYSLWDNMEVFKGKERLIYYHGLPAIATTCNDIWEVNVRPDYTAGVTEEQWWSELKKRQPYMYDDEEQAEISEDYDVDERRSGYFRTDAIEDTHIWWHRKEDFKIKL